MLTLQSEEDILAISLEDGRIVGADALNETLEEGIGGMLVDEGLVTDRGFEVAAGRVGTQEGRIGDILVDEDLVTREDFLAVLRRYTIDLVRSAQGWSSGEFRFYVGEDVSYEEGFQPIRMNELLPPGKLAESARVTTVEADQAEARLDTTIEEEVEEETFVAAKGVVETASDAAELEPVVLESVAEREEELEDEAELSPLQVALRRVNDWLVEAPDWVARAAPLLVVLVLAVMVVWRPNSLVYPFFWLETDRLKLEKQRRTSVYMKIDRGARTFFLLESRFPDDLHTLVMRGLLSPEDIVGAGGRVLSYLPGDRGYVVRPGATDGTDPGVSKTEAIAGDFFLDPEFVIQPPDRGPTPLVLLD